MSIVNSTLRISDGTTSVSLIAVGSGVLLSDWTPAITQPKDGGVFRDSPLADGRAPEFRKFANVTETFDVKIHGHNQDAVIKSVRNLRMLLEKAVRYWLVGHATEPVWIEVQGPKESNKRHALIYDYRIPFESNPFSQPFFTAARTVMDGFTIVIEREPFWRYEEPGTVKLIEASAVETWDSRNLGNVNSAGARQPITTPYVFFANKRTTANITNIYINAAGANLMDAALPFNLLPTPPAAGNAVYFGSRTALVNPAPFCSLVFDIGTPASDVTIVWEFSTGGGGWTAFGVAAHPYALHDNTDGFSVAGINSVSWFQNVNWAADTVNGVAAYWVRARVSAVGGAPSPPSQQNRRIYSATWPYAEIQADQLKGDRPALLRLKAYNHSCGELNATYVGSPTLFTDRLVIGARGVDRGANFTAYLNIANTQNPAGITVAVGPSGTAFESDVRYSPTGRCINWTPSNAIENWRLCAITLDNTIASQYFGKYHAYIRVRESGITAFNQFDLSLRVQTNSLQSTLLYQSERRTVIRASLFTKIIDMGTVILPPGGSSASDTVNSIIISVLGSWNDSTGTDDAVLRLYDLILIPVDEWSADFSRAKVQGLFGIVLFADNYLEIDSAIFSKRQVYAPVKTVATDNLEAGYRAVSTTPAQINPDNRIRLWMTSTGEQATHLGDASYPMTLHSIEIAGVQRYDSMIGDDIS